MRFRNWLLTGTSIGLFACAPLTVSAQDSGLVAAYQAYVAARDSGDAGALEAAQAAFTEQCIVAGYGSIDDCIARLNAPPAEPAAPVEEPAPAPEAAPAEAPAPQAAPVEAPAPELTPEPAPAADPAPAAEPAPAPEAEPAQRAAPVEEAAPEPAAAEPAPAEPVAPAAAPAKAAPENASVADIAAELTAQVDAYNAAIADILSGGDRAQAEAGIAAAKSRIDALCQQAGLADTAQCLTKYGLELTPVPDAAAAPAETVAPATDGAATIDDSGQPREVIEALPKGITEDQIAPVFDSAKDDLSQPAGAGTTSQRRAAPVDDTPPPADDAAATANIEAVPAADMSANVDQGTRIEAPAAVAAQLPANTTVVNQTVINNTTNTTTTNNTTNNTTNVNNGQIEQTQVVLQFGNQLIVQNRGQDTDRFIDHTAGDEVYYEDLGRGRTRETITRPDGSTLVTVRNANGDVLRRSRIDANGNERILAYVDDRYDNDLLQWRDPGDDLPPLRLNIPVNQYVIDSNDTSEDDVATFFRQPPVEQVQRLYSIDEVKRSARIRDTVRRLEVGGLTFDSGAASISRDQVGALSKVASAMLRLLDANPAETFLIEGHTDAVGTDIKNLQLSDLRAATIARILTDFYKIPPENLATQGYGERYLKIRTDLAERENRRVTIRRITPLVAPTASN